MFSTGFFVSLAVIFVSTVVVHSSEDCHEAQPIADFDATKLDGKWYVWKLNSIGVYGNNRTCYTITFNSQSDGDIAVEAAWFDPDTSKSVNLSGVMAGNKGVTTFAFRNTNTTTKIEAIGDNYDFMIWIGCVREADRNGDGTLVVVKDLDVSAKEQVQIESKLDPEVAKAMVIVDQTNC